MAKPYTIKLFVPDGDPSNFIQITKLNWTGVGLRLSRPAWEDHKKRSEFESAGVYILSGYDEGDEIPTVYVGQGDGVRSRIDSHVKTKSFWDRVIVFTTSNASLNRAHITWLEWALINKAAEARRCKLNNTVVPSEPVLTESEKADTREFLNELLSTLPLVDIPYFVKAEVISVSDDGAVPPSGEKDTVIVPAQEEGFKEEFLKNSCWFAIRISSAMLNKIRYIAAYQTAPISAITHYAEVATIEPFGDEGKYKLTFKGPARTIEPIPFADAKPGSMQGPRYAVLERLLAAKKVSDII